MNALKMEIRELAALGRIGEVQMGCRCSTSSNLCLFHRSLKDTGHAVRLWLLSGGRMEKGGKREGEGAGQGGGRGIAVRIVITLLPSLSHLHLAIYLYPAIRQLKTPLPPSTLLIERSILPQLH